MIRITDSNHAAIAAELAAVNGKATSFTIGSAVTVAALAAEAEAMLRRRGVPQTLRRGCTYSYTPAGPTASAYQYAAKSTHVKIERRSSDWYLVSASSCDVWPRDKERSVLHITPAARDAMIAHALRGCVVHPAAVLGEAA